MKKEELMEVLDMYHEQTRKERASDIAVAREDDRKKFALFMSERL